ncbi:hypothetical protein ACWCQS_44860 [Streptomyces sp. NPDC002076]
MVLDDADVEPPELGSESLSCGLVYGPGHGQAERHTWTSWARAGSYDHFTQGWGIVVA